MAPRAAACAQLTRSIETPRLRDKLRVKSLTLCGLTWCSWCCAQLTRGIEKTAAALVEELKALSVEVRDEDLANVATVSAGGNEVVRARTLGTSWPPQNHKFCVQQPVGGTRLMVAAHFHEFGGHSDLVAI
jgi:hypothetical protein